MYSSISALQFEGRQPVSFMLFQSCPPKNYKKIQKTPIYKTSKIKLIRTKQTHYELTHKNTKNKTKQNKTKQKYDELFYLHITLYKIFF